MTRRTHHLAVASLALLTAVTLAACQKGTETADPQPSPAQPTPAAPAAAPAARPTTAQPASQPAAGPTTATRRSDFGFIRSWYAKTGTFYLRFDRAVLLTGKAADAASAAHGGESPVPNDYYIQNDNPRLREVVIVDRAMVVGSQQLTGSPGPNPSSLKALLAFVAKGGPQVAATPFHLTYNDNGLVVRVREQYLP
jgi:hypothetical protein